MARVFLARDEKHDRPVAVKVMRSELVAAIDAERFLAEIRTTANLQHPHILPLHDSGTADGLLYFVMPFVSGESLRSLIDREGALPAERAVGIAARLAQALQHAHDHGILHRDIKPDNILMSNGEPMLADFGISLTAGARPEERLTRTGMAVGTPGYMSPEQLTGEPLTRQSDIFSLGALTYQMLTGHPPFSSGGVSGSLGVLAGEGPPDASAANPAVSAAVSRVVADALGVDPADRPETAAEFAQRLRAAAAPRTSPDARRSAIWAAAVALIAMGAAGFWYSSSRQERRARNVLLPEVQRLISDGQTSAAFELARDVREIIPDDPFLLDLWEAVAIPVEFTTEPAGAVVRYRPYDVEDTVWTEVGTTPLTAEVPYEELLVRFERDGYQTHMASLTPTFGIQTSLLTPDSADDMLWIESGIYGITGEGLAIQGYHLDRHEVTNADYQDFVSAGLDWSPEVWVAPLAARGIDVDPARVRTTFVDRTGRPGPAGWELSRHPDGEESLPVQGVSWYEAIAYCAFRGKELPTYYHWKYADGGSLSPWDGILEHANIAGGPGPLPVQSTETYSVHGVADLAGNVREWVWNASGDDRYIVGGSWASPPHLYTDYDATDPWSRSLENGFRCARYEETPDSALFASIELPVYDFNEHEAVDDETYRGYLTLFEYDRVPLEASREPAGRSATWRREHVEVSAAYPGERLPIHAFLPTNAEPPYQSVVYMPGGAAFLMGSSENVKEMTELVWVAESGRALFFPVIRGTYERRMGPTQGLADRRQRYVWMVQDIMRTVDYIEEQSDLDPDRIAFMGLSFGAELAVPVAVEKRFASAVLIGAALDPAWIGGVPDEVAPWNHVSRITAPSIVINGEYDFMHPFEESQIPFFERIDVPASEKEFVVLPTGHVPPNNEVVGHALRWLDRTLGPVTFARDGN